MHGNNILSAMTKTMFEIKKKKSKEIHGKTFGKYKELKKKKMRKEKKKITSFKCRPFDIPTIIGTFFLLLLFI